MAGEEIGTVNFVLELQEILCHQRADESGRRIIYEQEDLAGTVIPGVPDPGQYFLQDLSGKWIEKVDFANGEEAYYFNTNNIKTLGNSVLPNSYIDIYMKALDENDTLMVGKLLENIQVLAVHDSNGHNVFSDSANIGSTSYLGFALSHDYYILLQKAERLSSLGIELILAPQGVTPQVTDDENTVFVGSETLRDYIDANTVMLDDEHIEVKPEVEENNTTTNQANSGVNNQGVNNGTTQNPTNQTNTTTQTNVR